MTRKRNICGQCKHYSPEGAYSVGFGSCALMTDNLYRLAPEQRNRKRCYPWDYAGYQAGASVGEEFSCINFERALDTMQR